MERVGGIICIYGRYLFFRGVKKEALFEEALMEQLRITDQYKNILQKFTQGLKDIYPEELVSLII